MSDPGDEDKVRLIRQETGEVLHEQIAEQPLVIPEGAIVHDVTMTHQSIGCVRLWKTPDGYQHMTPAVPPTDKPGETVPKLRDLEALCKRLSDHGYEQEQKARELQDQLDGMKDMHRNIAAYRENRTLGPRQEDDGR